MKPAPRIAIVCLVLGVVLNVAIAWACAAWSSLTPTGVEMAHATPTAAAGSAGPQLLDEPTAAMLERRIGAASYTELIQRRFEGRGALLAGTLLEIQKPNALGHDGPILISTYEAGWPMIAFRGYRVVAQATDASASVGGAPMATGEVWHSAASAPAWLASGRYPPLFVHGIPYGPRLIGLVVNTVFYSVLASAVVLGWWWAQFQYRVYRRLCPACGYATAGLERCSECGLEVAYPTTEREGPGV